jgi:predicted nuclease of predicted toxin-antitoxin system
MNFLVDAQLPFGLSVLFTEKGYDSVHTSQLPDKNLTTDNTIRILSIQEKRIVVTKDSDFFDSYILKKEPFKVVFVRTGNQKTSVLTNLFARKFDQIIKSLEHGGLVEVTMEHVKILY